jgi:hypothetical protein
MGIPNEINKALAQMGLNASSLESVKLARGVVGKASYVAFAAMLALGVVAYSLKDPLFLFLLALLVVVLFAFYFGGALWFANKHPGLSLLEGAELLQWRQLEMAAKNVGAEVIEKKSEPVVISPSKEGE